MRKNALTWALIFLALRLTAQTIDLTQWELCFEDDFTSYRLWRYGDWTSIPDSIWRAHLGYDITHGKKECQIYQYDNAVFDVANGVVRLNASYDSDKRIPKQDYSLPHFMRHRYPNKYGTNKADNKDANLLLFFSGEIDTRETFGFGYYEIRCKLPIHNGSFPAFWLFGNGPNTYEEIDIFEYTNDNADGDYYRGYTSGIWLNKNGQNYDREKGKPECGKANKIVAHSHHIPATEPDLSEYHTYGCEWMPDVIRWYRDGQLLCEYDNADSIPQAPKRIKVNYALQRSAYNRKRKPNGWSGNDSMVVDYVRYYKPKEKKELPHAIEALPPTP